MLTSTLPRRTCAADASTKPLALRMLLRTTIALAWAVVSLSASAHHSSAMFDASRSLTLQGVVKEFRWENPHASIHVLVKDDAGREDEWSVEMNSPEYLARTGWQPDALQNGDAVSLVIHPMRDDTKSGQYVSGAGPRGPLMDASPLERSLTQTRLLRAEVSCPRVDVTVVEPSASSETRPVKLGEMTMFVQRTAITTTSDISEIKVAGDDIDTFISIKYKPEAAARLLAATTDHDGLKLAFVVDDDVWLAFTWRGPYGIGPEGTQISIRHGLARAEKLMESIRGCDDTGTR